MELIPYVPKPNKAPKLKAPKPEKLTPKDNPKEPFKGKKIWKQAGLNIEWMLDELARRLEMAMVDVLVDFWDELEKSEDETDEVPNESKKKAKTDFRKRIMIRAKLKGSK